MYFHIFDTYRMYVYIDRRPNEDKLANIIIRLWKSDIKKEKKNNIIDVKISSFSKKF